MLAWMIKKMRKLVGKKIFSLVALILGVGVLLRASGQVQAQSGVEVSSILVEHDFGEEIRFRVQIESSDPAQEVLLLFRDIREENTRIYPMSEENGEFVYIYDASNNFLHPFAQLSLWFQVSFENGEEFTSKRYSHTYSDDRFTWQTREDGNLRVYWSDGDETFGQAALDRYP